MTACASPPPEVIASTWLLDDLSCACGHLFAYHVYTRDPAAAPPNDPAAAPLVIERCSACERAKQGPP